MLARVQTVSWVQQCNTFKILATMSCRVVIQSTTLTDNEEIIPRRIVLAINRLKVGSDYPEPPTPSLMPHCLKLKAAPEFIAPSRSAKCPF